MCYLGKPASLRVMCKRFVKTDALVANRNGSDDEINYGRAAFMFNNNKSNNSW